MNNNHEEIINRLREPFPFESIEWKVQITSHDKARGMAVAYMDARAVQKRLDEILGPFNWKNLYSLWHDNSQICGISIFNAERSEWVTKFDGAENSDIEPIKGGLSDSFKRAASAWGVGRYLYQLDGIWAEIEPKGKSFVIKQNQFGKLEKEYNTAIGRIFGTAPSTPKQTPASAPPKSADTERPSEESAQDFKVHSVKPSGKSSQMLELIDGNGEVITAYIKASDQKITNGTHLRGVQMERKSSNYGEYNLINAYQLAA
jgi:hypothetical protein